jgi:hypothetical protein
VELVGQKDENDSLRFEMLSGVLPVEHRGAFELMMFRRTRGLALVTCVDMEEPLVNPRSGAPEAKVLFFVMCQASSVQTAARKVRAKSLFNTATHRGEQS